MYSGYGIAFHGAGLWSFGNEFAWNVAIFGVDISSSSHIDNCKNNFSVQAAGHTDYINRRIVAAERWFSINFSKAKTNFCLSLHYNHDKSYLFVYGKEIFKFKADNKMSTFQLNFI